MMKEILSEEVYMESVRNLEKTIAGWYKDFAHLPLGLRKWLGENLWWLVLIGVVLSVLAIFPILAALALVFGLSGAAIGAAGMYGAEAAVSGGLVGVALFAALVSVAGLVVMAVVMGLAINPLKARAKKGWTLLFIVLLVSTAFSVLGSLISFSIFGILWALVWAFVEGYFLFEVRDQFGPKVAAKPSVKKEVKA